jgi:glutathione S-transferase
MGDSRGHPRSGEVYNRQMITVHHLNNSRSHRIIWLLEEMSLEYRIEFYQRDPETLLAPPSLSKVHPLGKAPVVVDGDEVLAESGAIIDYMADRYGAGELVPPRDHDAYRRYRYWMHYAEGSAMPPVLLKLVFDRLPGPGMPFLRRQAEIRRAPAAAKSRFHGK